LELQEILITYSFLLEIGFTTIVPLFSEIVTRKVRK